MRLTLRTLLAFRDGVLDSKDAAGLEARIQESSTARAISQRMDEVVRNRKLPALALDERDFGREANDIANFLDDSMSQEHLPDMERKCLEDNALLAEVTSCHQILSRVVSVPLTIPQELRDRLYRICSTPGEAGKADAVTTGGAIRRADGASAKLAGPHLNLQQSGAGSTTKTHSPAKSNFDVVKPLPKPSKDLGGTGIELNDMLGRQVPEYLQGARRSGLIRYLQYTLLMLLFFAACYVAIVPLDRIGLLLKESGPVAQLPHPERSGLDRSKPVVPATELEVEASNKKKAPLIVETKIESEESLETSSGDIVESDARPPMLPSDINPSNAAEDIETSSVAPPPLPSDRQAADIAKQRDAPAKPAMIWNPESKSSVESLVFFSSDPSWEIASPGQAIQPKTRVVIPPAFRTEFLIPPGLHWTVASETNLEFLGTSKNGTPRVRLEYGRAIVAGSSEAKLLELLIDNQNIVLNFTDPTAFCGVEVQRALRLKTTDEGKSEIISEAVVNLVGLTEGVSVADGLAGDGGTQLEVDPSIQFSTVPPNTRMTIPSVGKRSVEKFFEAPWWVKSSVDRPIDHLAATDLYRLVNSSAGVEIRKELSELTSYRRSETAALAYRSRMLLGDFSNLFGDDGCFAKPSMRSHWTKIIDQIPAAIGAPKNVEAFKNSVRQEIPDRADAILDLLISKTQEQLDSGAAKMLVDKLSNSLLAERVFAIHQLVKITGKNLGYMPDEPSSDAIHRWKELLRLGEIRYSDPTQVENPTPN